MLKSLLNLSNSVVESLTSARPDRMPTQMHLPRALTSLALGGLRSCTHIHPRLATTLPHSRHRWALSPISSHPIAQCCGAPYLRRPSFAKLTSPVDVTLCATHSFDCTPSTESVARHKPTPSPHRRASHPVCLLYITMSKVVRSVKVRAYHRGLATRDA